MMHTITHGIHYADLNFQERKRVIATAVIDGPGGVTIVDPGPTTCLRTLREELGRHGVSVGDINTILLTHIHLDHAGASGTLVKENPDITVYVHERGARHMVDPTKLLSSATRLYGEEMDSLWGDFLPVPEGNIQSLVGGELLPVADRELEVAYLPGHASHHVGYFDRSSGLAFVGDTAGIRTSSDLFVLPPTPPPDINLELWRKSIETIRNWRALTLFVTHFGPHEQVDQHLSALLKHLDAVSQMAKRITDGEAVSDEARKEKFVEELRLYLQRYLPASEVGSYNHAAPLSQCWLGLSRYWRKRET